MSLTFAQLKTKVLGWLDESDDNATVLANVEDALNDANAARVAERDWPFMLSGVLTLTLTPGTRAYTLDATFDKPYYFYNRTKQKPLYIQPLANLDVKNAPWLSTGQTGEAVLEGSTLRLAYTPDSPDVIEYQCFVKPTEMSADNDLPDIPYPYSRVLIWDALLDIAAYSDDIPMAKMELWTRKQARGELALLGYAMDQVTREAPGQFVKQPDDTVSAY